MTRRFSVLGDSVSTLEGCCAEGFAVFYQGSRCRESGVERIEDTWWGQVIDGLNGEFLANASWSGSCVEGPGFPAGDSADRVEALSKGGEEPDDVLVFMGINDYGWGGVENQMKGRGSARPESFPVQVEQGVAEHAAGGALEAFGAAYESMLHRIRARYPEARVWCLSLVPGRVRGAEKSTFPRNFRGASFVGYNRAIERAAKRAGCSFCDLASLGFDYEALEGTHPTDRGMRQISWMALRAIQGAQAEAETEASQSACEEDSVFSNESPQRGGYPGGNGFASSDPCSDPGRSCIGCPSALGTGNQWMHVCLRTAPFLSSR